MSANGYYGILLDVNLTTREVTRFQVPENDLKMFVAGADWL